MTGMDLDKFEERSFYVESMVAVMEIGDQLAEQAIEEVTRSLFCNGI